MKNKEGNDIPCSVCSSTKSVVWFLDTSILVCGKSQCYSELLEDWNEDEQKKKVY